MVKRKMEPKKDIKTGRGLKARATKGSKAVSVRRVFVYIEAPSLATITRRSERLQRRSLLGFDIPRRDAFRPYAVRPQAPYYPEMHCYEFSSSSCMWSAVKAQRAPAWPNAFAPCNVCANPDPSKQLPRRH